MCRRQDVAAVVFSFVLFSVLTLSASAQVDRGAIVGTVTDQAGARVAGAVVTVTNVETNQPTKVTTNEEGSFSANLLRIGTYSISGEKKGFQKTVQHDIEVGVNQSLKVDLVLKVGSAEETVEVTSAPALLQTEQSSLGTIETERRISELPLNGRNFISLAYLGPGANAGQTGTNVSGGVFENERANEAISVNGLRVSNNNFLLNGVDNNEFGLGGVVVLPPPDAIQEFRTEENSMSAEFGRGGAAVNVVLKSGQNQIHGGLYEFIRNDKLDAVNYFNVGNQPFKRNQFGAFSAARSERIRRSCLATIRDPGYGTVRPMSRLCHLRRNATATSGIGSPAVSFRPARPRVRTTRSTQAQSSIRYSPRTAISARVEKRSFCDRRFRITSFLPALPRPAKVLQVVRASIQWD